MCSDNISPEKKDELSSLLDKWLSRAKQWHLAHRFTAKFFIKINYFIGILSVVLSTVAGTTVFINLTKKPDINIQIFVGMLTVFSSIFSALNTFLKLGELAEKHSSSATKYSSVCRNIELHLCNYSCHDLEHIKNRLDELSADCPNVPEWFWKKAQKLV